jgi:hypothetical protein
VCVKQVVAFSENDLVMFPQNPLMTSDGFFEIMITFPSGIRVCGNAFNIESESFVTEHIFQFIKIFYRHLDKTKKKIYLF